MEGQKRMGKTTNSREEREWKQRKGRKEYNYYKGKKVGSNKNLGKGGNDDYMMVVGPGSQEGTPCPA